MKSRRSVTLCHAPEIQRYTEQAWSVDLLIGLADLTTFVLELRLLIDELSDSLSLLSERLSSRVAISVDHAAEATVCQAEGKNCQVRLSARDAGFLCGFLMKYYRDGMAPVGHVDIDMASDSILGGDATLFVMVEDSLPPMPVNDARRLLKDM
jgi:hypothetical protein